MSPSLSKSDPDVPGDDAVPADAAPFGSESTDAGPIEAGPIEAGSGPVVAAEQPFDPWAPPGPGSVAGQAAHPQAAHPQPAHPQAAHWPVAGPGGAPAPWSGGALGAPPQAGWIAPAPGGWGGGNPALLPPGAVPGYYGPYAYPPRATNGLAIAALVTGLTCLWPLALVLGVIALVLISRRGERGRWQAVTGLVLSALGATVTVLLAVGLVAAGSDTSTGSPFAPRGSVSWRELVTGDCYNPAAGSTVGEDSVGWVTKVPCTLPHHTEVAGSVRIPAGPDGGYPGQDAIDTAADGLCGPVLSAYVLDEWALPDGVSPTYLYPTERNWRSSDGRLTCVLEDPDELHRGSLRTDPGTLTAAQLGYLQAVAPFNQAVDAMPIDDPEEAPQDYRLWAATMAVATQDEADKLAAISWPEAAKGPVDAMVAAKRASVAVWRAAAAASDAALPAQVEKGIAQVGGSAGQAKAVRAALGLSTGEQPGDLRA